MCDGEVQRKDTSDLDGSPKKWHKPVLERRCIWDFCLELALLLALEAGLALVDCAAAMFIELAPMRFSRWLGGCVDICTYVSLSRIGTCV